MFGFDKHFPPLYQSSLNKRIGLFCLLHHHCSSLSRSLSFCSFCFVLSVVILYVAVETYADDTDDWIIIISFHFPFFLQKKRRRGFSIRYAAFPYRSRLGEFFVLFIPFPHSMPNVLSGKGKKIKWNEKRKMKERNLHRALRLITKLNENCVPLVCLTVRLSFFFVCLIGCCHCRFYQAFYSFSFFSD